MHHIRALAFLAALAVVPSAASFAQSGSDVPPATTRSAVAGARSNGTLGTTTGNSYSPTSGTGGGGMSSGNGVKAGGQARKSKIPASSP